MSAPKPPPPSAAAAAASAPSKPPALSSAASAMAATLQQVVAPRRSRLPATAPLQEGLDEGYVRMLLARTDYTGRMGVKA